MGCKTNYNHVTCSQEGVYFASPRNAGPASNRPGVRHSGSSSPRRLADSLLAHRIGARGGGNAGGWLVGPDGRLVRSDARTAPRPPHTISGHPPVSECVDRTPARPHRRAPRRSAAIPGLQPRTRCGGARVAAEAGIGVIMAIKRHTLDIYGTELYLATNRRDWATLRRRLSFLDRTAPDSAGSAHFAVFQPNDGGLHASHLVFWIDAAAHHADLDLIDTAAHEATHGAGRIFEWVGHEIKGTDEPSAYLTGWLTRWIIEGVRGELT